MTASDSDRKLIIALAAALAAALLVIAFLLGRESAGVEPGSQELVAKEPPPAPVVDPDRRTVQGIERKPDGTILLSNTKRDAEAKTTTSRSAESRAAAGDP